MLQNKNMHMNCCCYHSSEQPVIEVREFLQASAGRVDLVSQEIIFVVRGHIHITMTDKCDMDCRLGEDEFVFMPIGSTLKYGVADNTVVLIVRLTGEILECHTGMFKTLFDKGGRYEGIYALRANERIGHYVAGLLSTMADGFTCRLYMQGEVDRMLFLIRAYYTNDECARFFSPVTGPDVKFSEFVRLNHTKYRTVGKMADAAKMSSQQFTKQFRKVFGVSPGEWIQRERARRIYGEICRNKKPLKEIADDYGFLSENFFRYCKHRFGTTPAAIRKAALQKCLPDDCDGSSATVTE